MEFSFNTIKAGASTAIAAILGLKLDQWNEQEVFGIDLVSWIIFLNRRTSDTSSIFEEGNILFSSTMFPTTKQDYIINGLCFSYIGNFVLSGDDLMAARLNLGTDPMAPGSLMYSWKLHPSVLSESEIALLSAKRLL